MDGKYNWYTAIPERDRIVIDATAKWLRPVPWQLFVTLTFSWNVRGETADLKLKQWLNTVERELKARSASSPAKNVSHPRSEWRCLGTSTYWLPLKSQYRRNYAKAPGGIWFVLGSDRIPAWGVDARSGLLQPPAEAMAA